MTEVPRSQPQLTQLSTHIIRTVHTGHLPKCLQVGTSGQHVQHLCSFCSFSCREITSPTPLTLAPWSPGARFSDPVFRCPQRNRDAQMCTCPEHARSTHMHTPELHHRTAYSWVCTCTQLHTCMDAHRTHTCTSKCHTVHLNQ